MISIINETHAYPFCPFVQQDWQYDSQNNVDRQLSEKQINIFFKIETLAVKMFEFISITSHRLFFNLSPCVLNLSRNKLTLQVATCNSAKLSFAVKV